MHTAHKILTNQDKINAWTFAKDYLERGLTALESTGYGATADLRAVVDNLEATIRELQDKEREMSPLGRVLFDMMLENSKARVAGMGAR